MAHRTAATLVALLLPLQVMAHGTSADGTALPDAFGATPVVSASLRGEWRIVGGTTAIDLREGVLRGMGVRLGEMHATAHVPHPSYMAFDVAPGAAMSFRTPGGALEALTRLSIGHRGGFDLVINAETLSLEGFTLRANGTGGLGLYAANGERAFTLSGAHILRDASSDRFFIMQMDLELSPELAGRLGRPEFAGMLVGLVDMQLHAEPATPDSGLEAPEGSCEPNFDGDVDVGLASINNPQMGLIAYEPGVRVAIAPNATLENVGTADVRWYWAINPPGFNGPNVGSHPYLVMHFYRIADGAIEQLGQSGAKHAWNTVNSGCPCDPGQVLYVGCRDTYNSGNNSNQFYIGPRDEVTAHTGAFEPLGSHFDGEPVDNFRDHGNDTGEHDDFEHLLVVPEADLTTPDAAYYAEVWYVVPDDIDIFNSMGHRPVAPALVDQTWTFPYTAGAATLGPAVDAWVNPAEGSGLTRNELVTNADGHLKLAVIVTDLGDGQYHYEYAIMNLDYDRKVQSFAVPVLAGATVSNADFGDIDADIANDWTVTVHAHEVRFTAPAGNALDWGTLFNFRFDADIAPTTAAALLGAEEPGDSTHLAVLSLAPLADTTTDTDGDGIEDSADNCTQLPNPDQRDTNGDYYGNVCDPDLNDDGSVSFGDLALLRTAFFGVGDLDADFDGSGSVNFADLATMKTFFFGAPGPSGVAPPP